MTINGGTFVLASGDDGMHADETLEVNGGDIRIANSYEGLESAVITINDGDIHVVASDDGVNVAGGGRAAQGRDGPTSFGALLPFSSISWALALPAARKSRRVSARHDLYDGTHILSRTQSSANPSALR